MQNKKINDYNEFYKNGCTNTGFKFYYGTIDDSLQLTPDPTSKMKVVLMKNPEHVLVKDIDGLSDPSKKN